MREILEGVARGSGGTYQLEYRRGTPANISNSTLVQRMVPTLERAFGKEHVLSVPPVMAADDFALFAQEVPGMFFFLGIVKPGTTSGANHTANFWPTTRLFPLACALFHRWCWTTYGRSIPTSGITSARSRRRPTRSCAVAAEAAR